VNWPFPALLCGQADAKLISCNLARALAKTKLKEWGFNFSHVKFAAISKL